MPGKDIKLAIKIAGEIDKSLGKSVDETKRQLRRIAVDTALAERGAASYQKGFESWSKGVGNVNRIAGKALKTAAVGATALIGATTAIGTASIRAGADFESAFAGIKKTVDATEPELNALQEQIRDMAKEKPQTAVELSAIGESAGQLGIAKENIAGFIDTVSDLTVATDLAADQGAADMARFANITQMPQDSFDRLGSTLVALGNNSAATESEILDMGMRIAAAGTQVGMTQPQIMGVAAALSSVGMEAEAGGSAISRQLVNMQLAVEQGTGALTDYASVAGMTREEFSELFKANPAQAFAGFVSGLNDTERNGKSAIAVLDDMGITEIRLRDALLRSANASELFTNTLSLSDEAWESNTALAKEAEQRYQTFDSRLQMVQNRLTDTGITINQTLNPALNDVLGIALDITKDGLLSEDYLEEMGRAVQERIPAIVRETKEAGNALKDFAGPFIQTAIDNLDLIGAGIVGVGTAITVSNVIDRIQKLTQQFGDFKAAMLAPSGKTALLFTGASVGVGALAALVAYLDMQQKAAKDRNLQQHFGEVALSIDDLKEAADAILNDGSLDKLDTAMESLQEVADLSKSFKKTGEELDKLDWKITAGVELTDADKTAYKNNLDQLISDTQAMLTERRYSSELNVELLLGDTPEAQKITSAANQYYTAMESDMERCGRELGELWNDAMSDGMIEPQEAKVISAKRAELARINAQLAQADQEGEYGVLQAKYGGGNLTPKSYQNLVAELDEQQQTIEASLDESLKASIAEQEQMRQSGQISQSTYERNVKALQQGRNEKANAARARNAAFQVETIEGQYKDELDSFQTWFDTKVQNMGGIDDVLKKIQDARDSGIIGSISEDGSLQDFLNISGGVDEATQAAFAELYATLEPQIAKIKEYYRQSGEEMPEELAKGIETATQIGVIAGSNEAMWTMLADSASNSAEREAVLSLMQMLGYEIPEQFAAGIKENSGAPGREIESMRQNVLNAAQKPLYATMPVTVRLQAKMSTAGFDATVNKTLQNKLNKPMAGWTVNGKPVKFNAEGGIYDNPFLSWVAEDGPEAIIPLGQERRSRGLELYEQAGKALGVTDSDFGTGKLADVSERAEQNIEFIRSTTQYEQPERRSAASESKASQGSSEVKVQYAPVFNLYGSASETEVRRAAGMSQEEFGRYMEKWQRNRQRLIF